MHPIPVCIGAIIVLIERIIRVFINIRLGVYVDWVMVWRVLVRNMGQLLNGVLLAISWLLAVLMLVRLRLVLELIRLFGNMMSTLYSALYIDTTQMIKIFVLIVLKKTPLFCYRRFRLGILICKFSVRHLIELHFNTLLIWRSTQTI